MSYLKCKSDLRQRLNWHLKEKPVKMSWSPTGNSQLTLVVTEWSSIHGSGLIDAARGAGANGRAND